ncbi:MAG TPA: FkbM family methyltransferase [Victivallis vadensis]|nr:FkbM family methyltransferase [Victivallis vadensis]
MIDFDYCSPEVAVENWKECLIYGAGNRGREVLAVLRRKGVRVVGFLDSGGKAGSAVDGVPVLEPRELPPLSRDLPVVIAVFSYPVAGETARIVGDLLPLGYRKLIDFETFFQACREEFRDSCFWLEHPDYFRKHRDEITRAAALFEEEDSRKLFEAQINHRLGQPYTVLPPISGGVHYFPGELCGRRKSFSFVDIGAFTGDTLVDMEKAGITPGKVWAFEPDLENFRKLVEQTRRLNWPECEFTLFPIGVGEKVGSVSFCADGSMGSAFGEGGDGMVPVAALDELLHGVPVDYVKMDVEGSEESCLLGMREIIRVYRPVLAVCLYHRPSDIFRLPLLIAGWNQNYRFLLRTYYAHCMETVLYAIPGELPVNKNFGEKNGAGNRS